MYSKGAYLAVYQFCGDKKKDRCQQLESKQVVLLIAGCANSVAVYSMLEEKSLPDYLYSYGYDVWCMDLRGHGESEPPEHERRWDIGTYAFIDTNTVVTYICAHTGCASVNLIGHSMGGMIAMALISHPELHIKVKSVTALGSSIYLGHSICRLLQPWLPVLRVTGGN